MDAPSILSLILMHSISWNTQVMAGHMATQKTDYISQLPLKLEHVTIFWTKGCRRKQYV